MNILARYASLVRFAHTIFALPFALIGYVSALVLCDIAFDGWTLVKILLCMVFARNAAMGFNRLVDRDIDAENPRTASREIPSGAITPKQAAWFVAVNAVGFLVTAALINRMTFFLSPVALFIILSYSYMKRSSAWTHIVLGVSLAMAPAGAYIAVTASLGIAPLILAGVVITWVAGFDIIYSMQDAEFDRAHGLHSIPARFSNGKALAISLLLHLVSIYAILIFGIYYDLGNWYWIGAGLFIALLLTEHILVTPRRQRCIGIAFGIFNGVASAIYAVFTITALLLR